MVDNISRTPDYQQPSLPPFNRGDAVKASEGTVKAEAKEEGAKIREASTATNEEISKAMEKIVAKLEGSEEGSMSMDIPA